MAARTLGQINAMANITSQTDNQRTAFGERFGGQDTVNKLTKGVAGDLTGIFNSFNANEINSNAFLYLKKATIATTRPQSYNPDFSNIIYLNFKDAPTYDSLTGQDGSIESAKDKPSLIGPNLRSIGFDANGAPAIPASFANLNRTTGSNPDNRNAIGTQGFGRFYNNVNNLGPRFANYLSDKFDNDSNNDPDLGKSKNEIYSEGPIGSASSQP